MKGEHLLNPSASPPILPSRLRPAVFLDRDGVLNRTTVRAGTPCPPGSLAEVEILPGVENALRRLRERGLPLIVVTNQPDVARGTQKQAAVEEINTFLARSLGVTAVYTCYHDNTDDCVCRKPRPGMLDRAAQEHGIDLTRSFMVGDRWGDVAAGAAAGCTTLLIDMPYSQTARCTPDFKVADLAEAAEIILIQHSSKQSSPSPQHDAPDLRNLRVKIFADGADRAGMLEMARKPHIAGLTTNPTLMRKAGITDYRAFAKDLLSTVRDKPVSFEVFCDDFAGMEKQAREIASWGPNVYVKIPVTNCGGESACGLIGRLARAGVKQNVTALMTLEQVRDVSAALGDAAESYISVFAGRVADTGRDPVPMMAAAVEAMRPFPNQQLIWASPRELLNIFHADAIGCHIITVTNDVLKKLELVGKDLNEYSLDTVKMFHADATAAGFTL